MLEKSVVDIINIHNGLLPEGACAHFLADALKELGLKPESAEWIWGWLRSQFRLQN